MVKNIQVVDFFKNEVVREVFLFLLFFGFFNIVVKVKINFFDILLKEEVLFVILNSSGKQQDVFVRVEKLELKRLLGQKFVKLYNYFYFGYIQFVYDMKILFKKEYQDVMVQVQLSEKEYEKMIQQLIKKNDDIIVKVVYEGRLYLYDDLIFVRFGFVI